MKSGGFLFFAFGECLDESKMTTWDSRCEVMGLAKADGQRLSFTSAGVANLKAEAEAETWGLMWLVPADKMPDMDRWAVERGLKRGVVSVVSPAGPRVPCTAYFDRSAADGLPDESELQLIVSSAKKWGMDKAYLAELTGWMNK